MHHVIIYSPSLAVIPRCHLLRGFRPPIGGAHPATSPWHHYLARTATILPIPDQQFGNFASFTVDEPQTQTSNGLLVIPHSILRQHLHLFRRWQPDHPPPADLPLLESKAGRKFGAFPAVGWLILPCVRCFFHRVLFQFRRRKPIKTRGGELLPPL
uniref:Uncharacterized protein n=1 Tax=Opuntia streptacantha TaxID=393608 RepID=A0A7C9CPD5_OPUST